MTTIRRRLIRSLIAISASTSLAHAATAPAPLSPEQSDALLNCPISLASAKENLAARDYTFVSSEPNALVTQFKTSLRDSERKLLGSFSLQRERQYQVTASSPNSIRISPRYRETEYASEGRGNYARDTVKEYAVPLTAALADTLRDMQSEVCTLVAQKLTPEAAERKSPQIDQYLRQRCKAGDEAACQLLSAK